MAFLRSQSGFGHIGSRQYGRSYAYGIRKAGVTTFVFAPTIKFTSSTGAILGTVRTDVAKSIVRSIRFTKVKGDCKDGEIVLNDLPTFPLIKYSFIQIKVGSGADGWFFGKLVDVPEPGDKNKDGYKFSLLGMSEILKKLDAETYSYPALTDIGEVIYDLVQQIVEPETEIKFRTALVEQATGKPLAATVTFDKSSLHEIFTKYALATGCDWGVNGNGEFFFQKKDTSVKNVYFAGYRIEKIDIKTDTKNIKNRVVGTRKEITGSGTPGWKVGAISIDVKSQKKYETQEKVVQFPGNASNDDIKTITDAILAELKDPTRTAKFKLYGIKVSDYIDRGYGKLVLPFADYDYEYESLDDPVADFTKTGAGNLARYQDTTEFIDGQSSMRLEWTSAASDYVSTTQELKAKINRLEFYIRQQVAGVKLRVGIGWGAWNTYTKEISVPSAGVNLWVPVIWDLSEYNITKINKLGFQVVGSGSGVVNLDRIHFNIYTAKHENLEHYTQTYSFMPGESSIDIELGPNMSRLEAYLSEIREQGENARSAGQIP